MFPCPTPGGKSHLKIWSYLCPLFIFQLPSLVSLSANEIFHERVSYLQKHLCNGNDGLQVQFHLTLCLGFDLEDRSKDKKLCEIAGVKMKLWGILKLFSHIVIFYICFYVYANVYMWVCVYFHVCFMHVCRNVSLCTSCIHLHFACKRISELI